MIHNIGASHLPDEFVKSITLTGSEINVFNGDNTVDHLQLPSGFTGVTTDITLTGNGLVGNQLGISKELLKRINAGI